MKCELTFEEDGVVDEKPYELLPKEYKLLVDPDRELYPEPRPEEEP